MSFHPTFYYVLKEKGCRYAYNYLQFWSFYNTRHPRLVALLKKLAPYPFYIEIENTTYCNLRCTICERTYWNEKPYSMSFEQFKAIVDQFPRLKWIGLTGIGESYLNRDFSKMLHYCKQRKLIVEIYDAFFFVDEVRAEELIDLGVEQIFCSMDAATKTTYESIRVGSNFDRVVSNLRRFVEIKRRKGRFFPVLDFHYIINKANYDEVLPYVELVADIAPGSSIQFSRLLHKYPQIEDQFIEVSEEKMLKVQQRCSELGVGMYWNPNASLSKPPMHDCITWYMPFIFVTGEVIPCCSANEANVRDFQKETSMGNVFEQPFRDIWWGKKYTAFRKQLREGKKPRACKDCCLYTHPEELPL